MRVVDLIFVVAPSLLSKSANMHVQCFRVVTLLIFPIFSLVIA